MRASVRAGARRRPRGRAGAVDAKVSRRRRRASTLDEAPLAVTPTAQVHAASSTASPSPSRSPGRASPRRCAASSSLLDVLVGAAADAVPGRRTSRGAAPRCARPRWTSSTSSTRGDRSTGCGARCAGSTASTVPAVAPRRVRAGAAGHRSGWRADAGRGGAERPGRDGARARRGAPRRVARGAASSSRTPGPAHVSCCRTAASACSARASRGRRRASARRGRRGVRRAGRRATPAALRRRRSTTLGVLDEDAAARARTACCGRCSATFVEGGRRRSTAPPWPT